MKTKIKINKNYFYILILFLICSITSIYSFTTFLYTNPYSLVIKQIIFYILGIILILLIKKIKIENILKYSMIIYILNIILLILVLIFGAEINGVKAWFKIPIFGSLQPSEFMKIGIILICSKIINDFIKNKDKNELKLIIKIILIILIPSIITFLEPDTGAVLIYIIIGITMLFISGINYKWFIILFGSIILFGGIFLGLYIFKTELFINIFGSNFFYRFDRIIDWQNSSGMQLTNSLIAISSSKIFGNGINNLLLYFPEGHTDFIFASFASIYGLIGIIILITLIIIFDIYIIKTAKKTKNNTYKLICMGTIGVLLYQQIQNISMTIGILPITGITLPFISYGGSSLLSFMILLGLIIEIDNKKNT